MGNLILKKVCNSLVFLKDGVVPGTVWPILSILPFQLQKDGWVVLGELATSLVPLALLAWVDTWKSVLKIIQGVIFVFIMLYGVLSTMSSCTVGFLSACYVYIAPVHSVIASWLFVTIIGPLVGTNTGNSYCLIAITWNLNKFW